VKGVLVTSPSTPPRHDSTAARSDLPADQIDSYEVVLDLVRSGAASTRPEIGRLSGLGRSIVSERVDQAIARGLLEESDLGPSTGGRAPRRLRFVADRAYILLGGFGALGVGAAVADLAGNLIASTHGPWTVESGPEASLEHLAGLFDEVRSTVPRAEIWGVSIGLPGPVEYATGRPVAPPIMPGWDGFDVRGWLGERLKAPVWVDNDANLMALGHMALTEAPVDIDLLFVKLGSGLGAGLVSHGRLHRGANGSAGDIGHVALPGYESVICRCGRRGCLEAIAGGWALARDAEIAADEGRSRFLAERLAVEGVIRPIDVVRGSVVGDAACVELVERAGHLIGEEIASMASFFNPSVIAVGGGVAAAGDLLLATIRQVVYSRSLTLATRDLQIVATPDDADLGLRGGASLVLAELFDRGNLRRWFAEGSPLAQPSAMYGEAPAAVA
jgi:predicted NBD/HSP70 family sugar kinase